MRIILWRGTHAFELRSRGDAPKPRTLRRVEGDPQRLAEMILRLSPLDSLRGLLRAPNADREELSAGLRTALRRERVLLWRRPARALGGGPGDGGGEGDEALLHTPNSQKTWIEIELVDMEGNPMPGEPYRIKLPDGTERRGTLDGQGRAYFGGLDPGQAEIFWEARDGEATELAPPLGQGPLRAGSVGGAAPTSRHERHWVELELLDMDGAPVPNERYWIKLPDGSVRHGSLDARGLAYFDDLDPGQCEIRWPDRDEGAAFCEPDPTTAPASGPRGASRGPSSDADSAQVAALLSASRDGTPFCEECERQRLERESTESENLD